MTQKSPFTWKPTDVVKISNTGSENVLLELESGLLRLDAGRSARLTATALQVPQVKALLEAGQIRVEAARK